MGVFLCVHCCGTGPRTPCRPGLHGHGASFSPGESKNNMRDPAPLSPRAVATYVARPGWLAKVRIVFGERCGWQVVRAAPQGGHEKLCGWTRLLLGGAGKISRRLPRARSLEMEDLVVIGSFWRIESLTLFFDAWQPLYTHLVRFGVSSCYCRKRADQNVADETAHERAVGHSSPSGL